MYVQRDGSGNIIAVYAVEQDTVKEFVPDDDPAVVEFIHPHSWMTRVTQQQPQPQQQQQKADEET